MRTPDPSPDEILERSAEIREGWTLAEHYRRAGELPPWFIQDRFRSGRVAEALPPLVTIHVDH